AAGGDRDAVRQQRLDVGGRLMAHHAQRRADLGGAERRFLPEHLDEVPDDALGLLDLALVALQGDVLAAGRDAHLVLRFEGPQVLVASAEEGEVVHIGGQDDAPRGVSGFSQRVFASIGTCRRKARALAIAAFERRLRRRNLFLGGGSEGGQSPPSSFPYGEDITTGPVPRRRGSRAHGAAACPRERGHRSTGRSPSASWERR